MKKLIFLALLWLSSSTQAQTYVDSFTRVEKISPSTIRITNEQFCKTQYCVQIGTDSTLTTRNINSGAYIDVCYSPCATFKVTPLKICNGSNATSITINTCAVLPIIFKQVDRRTLEDGSIQIRFVVEEMLNVKYFNIVTKSGRIVAKIPSGEVKPGYTYTINIKL